MPRKRFIPCVEQLEAKLLLAGVGPAPPPGGLLPAAPAIETGTEGMSVSFRTEHIVTSNYLVVEISGSEDRTVSIVGGASATTDDFGIVRLWYPHGALRLEITLDGENGGSEALATLTLDYSGKITGVSATNSAALSASPTSVSPILLTVDPTTVLHDAFHSVAPDMPMSASLTGDLEMASESISAHSAEAESSEESHASMPTMEMSTADMEMPDGKSHRDRVSEEDGSAEGEQNAEAHLEGVAEVTQAPATRQEPSWEEEYVAPEAEAKDTTSEADIPPNVIPSEPEQIAATTPEVIDELLSEVVFELPISEEDPDASPQPLSRLSVVGYTALGVGAALGAITCERMAREAARKKNTRRLTRFELLC